MSERYKTKEERDDFLELWGIDFDNTDQNGYDLTDYYESGKPMTLEGWEKLIEDLNQLFENPPGDCSAIEAIEIPEAPYVWTLEDVEDIREKMLEMCSNIEFNWGWYLPNWTGSEDDKNLSNFPFGREIIYEMIDQMAWCGCGDTSYVIRELFVTLGGCRPSPPEPPARTPIGDLIEGLPVGVPGNDGSWRFYSLVRTTVIDADIAATRALWAAAHPGEAIPWIIGRVPYANSRASGNIGCAGIIECGSSCATEISDESVVNYTCIPITSCDWILDLGGDPDDIQELYDECVANREAANAQSLADAEASVANATAEGYSVEYTLVVNQGSPDPTCP